MLILNKLRTSSVAALSALTLPHDGIGVTWGEPAEAIQLEADVTRQWQEIDDIFSNLHERLAALVKRSEAEQIKVKREKRHGHTQQIAWGMEFAAQLGFAWYDLTGDAPHKKGARLETGHDSDKDVKAGFTLFVECAYASAFGIRAADFKPGQFAVEWIVKKAVEAARKRFGERWAARNDAESMAARLNKTPNEEAAARRAVAKSLAWRAEVLSDLKSASADRPFHTMIVARRIERMRRIPEYREFVEAALGGEFDRLQELDERIDQLWKCGGDLGDLPDQWRALREWLIPPSTEPDNNL